MIILVNILITTQVKAYCILVLFLLLIKALQEILKANVTVNKIKEFSCRFEPTSKRVQNTPSGITSIKAGQYTFLHTFFIS